MHSIPPRLTLFLVFVPISAFGLAGFAPPCGVSALAESPTQSASEAAPASTALEPLTLNQLRAELTEVAARRVDVTRKLSEASQTQGPNWLLNSLQYEINQLKFLELTLAQQEVLLENRADLERQLQAVSKDPAQWAIEQIDAQPPYSFLLLERLRDDHADVQARNELSDLEIDTAIELLDQAKHDFQERQRERRRLRETLLATHDAAERVKIERQLVNAELICRIFDRVVQSRKLGVEVKKLERDYQSQRTLTLAGAIELVAANAPFTQQDLGAKFAEIDRQEAELRSRLPSLHDRLNNGAGSGGAAVSNRSAAEAGETSDDTRNLFRQTISQVNESLADLVILRYVWNERFRVANGLSASKEAAELVEQLNAFQRRFLNARQVLELRVKETRLRFTRLESTRTLRGEEPHSQMLREFLDVSEAHTALLQRADRLVRRFRDELISQHRVTSLKQSAARVFPIIKDWWSYEVLVVDDRPITIGKIFTAVLMLFGGWILSRRLSRMLGKRMLPRFGIHDGASLALQTIAFYTMTIICGFITLDMLNIPLTVFTFLGGAAAIAVGFGSQNILNNFISGLIILGEQPVRVGDLVEIDGLHANIEHIGTRSTRVRTGSNLEIIVPNSRFLEHNVTNWTLSNNEIRICVKVGVAYGSPVDHVLRLLRQTVEDEPLALHHPEPIFLFSDFADNSLNFEAHFWVRMRTHMEGRRVESSVRQRIDAAFRQADITIAFPQRDVHLDVKQPLEISLSTPRDPDALRGLSRAA